MKFIRENKGFSLIELLTVIAILGILATIAIPAYQGYQRGAARQEATTNLQELAVCLQQYYAENNQYQKNGDATPITYQDTWNANGGVVNNQLGAPGGWLTCFKPRAAAGSTAPNYDYSLTVNAGSPPTFLATATPQRGPVKGDPLGSLTINQDGAKTGPWPQ